MTVEDGVASVPKLMMLDYRPQTYLNLYRRGSVTAFG